MKEDGRPATPGDYGNEVNDLDLGAMWRALTRRKSWIIGTTAFFFLATLAYVIVAKPRYTADSQVLVESQENFFTRPDSAAANPAQPPDDQAVASQIELLTSRDLARQVSKSLGLAQNPEFNPQARTGALGRIASLIGLSRAPSALSEEDQVLQNYYQSLSVFQVAKSRVLQVEFTSQDRDLSARAANAIANSYIDVQIDAKKQAAKDAAGSLAKEVSGLQTRLASAEDQAENFRASSGLLVGVNNTTLSDQQLADLNTQLAAARTSQSDAQAKSKLIRDSIAQGRLDEISDIANNDLVRQISLQRVGLRGQLALASRTLLPQHPRIKELRAQLTDIDSQLRMAALTVARGLENDARVAEARYENIRATLDQQKQAVGDSGGNQVRLRALDRNAKLISDQLEASMTKYQEAIARETASSTPGDARVISRAMAPQTPSFPKKIPLLIFATLAAFVLSTAAAIAGELLSGPDPQILDVPTAVEDLRPANALRERLRPPVLPSAASAPQTVAIFGDEASVGSAPSRAAWDAMSSLVAQAAAISRASGRAACLLVLGASESANAGAAAVDIGRALAGGGRSILVELRQGLLVGAGLASAEGCRHGLGELVDGEKSFAEVIHRDGDSRLHFIVAGSAVAHSGDALDIAVEALGETYDHVILLAAPFTADPLAIQLAGAADIVGFVSAGRGSEAKLIEARSELIRAGAGEVVVLSAVRQDAAVDQVSAA